MISKLWMKHSVYERDKLSNKEQIESAVSGNIKADLSPNRDRECCGDTQHQATHVLAGLNTKHRLEQNVPCKSSGQNITISSQQQQYGDLDSEIAAKLLSASLSFLLFFSAS